MNILGIETSCDETSAAIVRDGRFIVANIIASQIDLHRRYGGVVPELASRQHIVTMLPVLEEAFRASSLNWVNVDAVAVTRGPGLSPALLVGVNTAKALAFARQKPLVAVDHIEGHLYSNWIVSEQDAAEGTTPREPRFPLVCLVVSGGHTELLLMTGHGRYRLLGKTIDDAAGEAFDKAARILGLGYPGGPAIQAAAATGDAARFNFPRAWLKGTLDFSFSGLKTALLRKVEEYGVAMARPAPWQRSADLGITVPQSSQGHDTGVLQTSPKVAALAEASTGVSSFRSEPLREEDLKVPPVKARVSGGTLSAPPEPEGQLPTADRGPLPVADLAASFQAAIVEILVEKTAAAVSETGAAEVLLAGGVAANSLLRQSLANRLSIPFRYPPLDLCTDNAAMIAAAAYFRYTDYRQHDLTLDIEPNHRFY